MFIGASRTGVHKSLQLAKLFGTASVVAMAAGGAAAWAGEVIAQADDIPETVLITGSLIQGAVSVGVPVNSLRTLDFVETGQLALTDILKSVPALDIDAQSSPTYGGGTLSFLQNVEIHSLGTGNGTWTLLMVNGLRFPPQNYSGDTTNPSIIPQIAIDRVDVLTAGASAVYGSDATAGVINIILRRGFDGAMTQLGFTSSPQIGYLRTQAAQLYGHSWDTGNVTASYTFTTSNNVPTEERFYYSQDFRPLGLLDLTPRTSSIPGTVHVGNAISHDWLNNPNPNPYLPISPPTGFGVGSGTEYCAGSQTVPDPDDPEEDITIVNQAWPLCYSIPRGQNGVGLTWDDIVANTGSDPTLQNLINNWHHADGRPSFRWNQLHFTLDQRMTPNLFGLLGPVSFFAEGFYSDQRGKQRYPAAQGQGRQILRQNLRVPTDNPYYPEGAPSNLRVDYSFAIEVPVYITGGERASRIAAGFNFDELPFDWVGKFTYSYTYDHNYGYADNSISPNAVNAALGRTIDAEGLYQSYTKPASIPYLNVFCDPTAFTCNDPLTLQYITGFRHQDSYYKVNEIGVNFSGPIIQLPGGPLEGAIAFQHLAYDYKYQNLQNDNTHSTEVFQRNFQENVQTSYAFFGQLNVPVVGPEMGIPFVERLLIELGYRYDKYDTIEEPIWVRKIAGNWTIGYGFTLRGAWGESFRVPSFNEGGDRTRLAAVNPLAGYDNTSDVAFLDCSNQGIPGAEPGVALPGSVTAILNPTCSSEEPLRQPGAISAELVAGGHAEILRGYGLGPMTLNQWSTGFRFAPPSGILAGLDVDVSWFRLEFKDLIQGAGLETFTPDDPRYRQFYTVIPRADLPITAPENAEFYDLVQRLAAYPSAGGFSFDPNQLVTCEASSPLCPPERPAIENIKLIQDAAQTNIGSRVLSGIDFVVRYDYDLGEWGSINVGASGYYRIIDKTRPVEGGALDDEFQDRDSGNRLQRVRYRLGWANPTWNVTLFGNYIGHGNYGDDFGMELDGNSLIPPCFYAPGFAPGSCYPGSPYYGPQDVFYNMLPATVLFDLSIGYQTGETPTNEWLRNIGIQFTVNNIFDEPGPMTLNARGNAGIRWHTEGLSDLQRTFTLQLTKVW
jgi:outer membrane receptor protein involved in Fe transport